MAMSILMEVFAEELDRLNRQEVVYRRAMQELPKGYISRKRIKEKEYFYLQRRENGKIVSQYVSADELPGLEAQIARRKGLEDALRRVKEDRKRLERVLR